MLNNNIKSELDNYKDKVTNNRATLLYKDLMKVIKREYSMGKNKVEYVSGSLYGGSVYSYDAITRVIKNLEGLGFTVKLKKYRLLSWMEGTDYKIIVTWDEKGGLNGDE